jgi:hypothetical protein
MIAILRLDRAMYLADLGMKYNVVEFLDHLPRVKFTQITTPLARRTLRVSSVATKMWRAQALAIAFSVRVDAHRI